MSQVERVDDDPWIDIKIHDNNFLKRCYYCWIVDCGLWVNNFVRRLQRENNVGGARAQRRGVCPLWDHERSHCPALY
jgi:hypothetical protein